MNSSWSTKRELVHRQPTTIGVFSSIILLVVTLSSLNVRAGALPIQSQPHGQSYGAWTVAWWQWALGIAETNNPLLDTTGEFAGVNQTGQVWFLAGSLAESETRTFTIPAGQSLFLPVHGWIFGATVNDCEPSVPGVTCDEATLRASAAAAATAVTNMQVTIDGQPVTGLQNYRALSPETFTVTLPPGNLLGLPAGTYGPHVSDGYWLMLTPLSVGEHTIVVHAENPSFDITYTVTYHITVEPRGR